MAENSTAPGGLGGMAALIQVMRQVHGLEVSRYDLSFLNKAVEKRRLATASATLTTYLDSLTQSRPEAEALLGSLEIHYSELFRDTLAFAQLEQIILPSMVAKKEASDHSELRIWSAGCAAGQEAYSLAILLLELSETRERPVRFRIFATDTSEAQLSLGRAGEYPEAAMDKVRLGHVGRWFSRQGSSYVATSALRDCVDFSVHDLLDEHTTRPPGSIFGEFDLVLCCNVLFYYGAMSRQIILDRLRNSMITGGYLMTGQAERDQMQDNSGLRAVMTPASVFQRVR